jgi:hypothetical protein
MSACPLPEGKVDNATIENTALLALESSSPFPPNDMFWGYSVDKEFSMIHIFSALKSRVKVIDEAAEAAAYVLPDFLVPLFDPTITKAILKHNDFYAIYEKNANSEIAFSTNVSSDLILPAFELQAMRAIPEFGVIINYTQRANPSAQPTGKTIELPFLNAKLMAANMQNADLKKAFKQSKLTTNITLNITVFAIFLAILTLGGCVVCKHMLRKEKNFSNILTNKDEQVKQIQQKDERAHELDLFSNKKHAYFRGLDKINSLRPESILFKTLYASEGENFEFKCSAKSLDDIEKFQNTLNESDFFKVVKIEDKNVQVIQNEQVFTFSLFLTFKQI